MAYYSLRKVQLNKPLNDMKVEFLQSKDWGYRSDLGFQTHPIAGDVDNTLQAEGRFDGITYSKGGAVINQLLFLLGEERFFNGLKLYFSKFPFANTTLDDFINVLNGEFIKTNAEFTLQE